MRPEELPIEPRLADTGLANDRDDLTMATPCALDGLAELLHFWTSGHEPCQPASGGDLEPRTHRPSPDQFVHLHRLRKALYRHRAAALHFDVALDELQGRG